MLIRERGKLITLLRPQKTEQGGASSRARHVVMGVFRVDDEVPVEVLETLSRDERRTLAEWLKAYQRSQTLAQAQVSLRSAPAQLDELVSALATAAELLQPDRADHMWQQITAIARLLRRAGHPKPKAARPPASMPGQMDLVDALDTRDAGTSIGDTRDMGASS
ncbi:MULTISPECIES: hypothetical protein [Paraburkholderia]|uniref:Uncharacterized protein n=1 Tax=Paraburkholderia acidicola TaxID=1912599 RepID=A0ABV1LYQ8_9BURK